MPKRPYTIPPDRIRGYATLAPEFAQYGVNVAGGFCHYVVEGGIPHGSLSAELQARMTRDQLKTELASAFEKVGAWPCDYDFEQIILVLCDDSVRKPGPDKFGWPEEVLPIRRRVILEFLWYFPEPCTQCLPCIFWVSYHPKTQWSVCKFAFQQPRERRSRRPKRRPNTQTSQRPKRDVSTRNQATKAVRDMNVVWELGGESDLRAATLPHPPTANQVTTIRMTHCNTCGPLDDADFFVRLGDLYRPTAPGDLDSGGDWVPAVLVEELVFVNGEEIISSEVHEALTEETPW